MRKRGARDALAALAQSTRLDVFRLLVKHEPEGLAAGEIAKKLAVPQNTMSARYLKNRIAIFTSLPFSSIDRLSLGTKLRDIGRIEGATIERGKAS